jgi:hypothetical protein
MHLPGRLHYRPAHSGYIFSIIFDSLAAFPTNEAVKDRRPHSRNEWQNTTSPDNIYGAK